MIESPGKITSNKSQTCARSYGFRTIATQALQRQISNVNIKVSLFNPNFCMGQAKKLTRSITNIVKKSVNYL